MSYQGQTWVDNVALPLLKNGGELLVMLRVANHAGNGPKKMSGCFAGSKTIAAECLMSPRAAQEHLRELVRRALLIPGDPRLVENIRPDRRPPVYDLAGAHEPGCPGEHDIDGDCLPAPTGSENCHPSPKGKNCRSAGSGNRHPSKGAGGTGGRKRHSRVAESATKSSKGFKAPSLSADDAPSEANQAATGTAGEREKASPKDTNTPPPAGDVPQQRGGQDDLAGRVVAAYTGAHLTAVGMPPRPAATKQIYADATALLAGGRSVENLIKLAAELPAKGWSDLAQHAAKNPEQKARGGAAAKPWCGECDSPEYRWIVPQKGAATKCPACHPAAASQLVNA